MGFIRYLPGRSGTGDIEIEVVDVLRGGVLKQSGYCRRWDSSVQLTIDAAVPPRVDKGWRWQKFIAPLTFWGGIRRGARLLTILAGPQRKQAAMVALLENERWIEDEALPAVYVWYISTAPETELLVSNEHGASDTPKMIGLAAIDTALQISLGGPAAGRLWLHADPAGMRQLTAWYGVDTGATCISKERFGRLPGDMARGGRINDGRYFAFTEQTALWATARFDAWR